MQTSADRAAWFLAALIAYVFGRVELDEVALELARTAPHATA